MKLYATTTSERASKGQGGNEFIRVEITAELYGKRENILTIEVKDANSIYSVFIHDTLKKRLIGTYPIIKGKRQKGE